MSFEPQTAREGLLEIRRLLSRTAPADYGLAIKRLDAVAEASLARTAPVNFELSDHLADRLAEAHNLLRGLGEVAMTPESDAELVARIPQVLSLPPDLEAMVERRIGPT